MNNGFQWTLELIDKMSAPAREADAATGDVVKQLGRLQKQIADITAHPLEFKQLRDAQKQLNALRAEPKVMQEPKKTGVALELENVQKRIADIKAHPFEVKQLASAQKQLQAMTGGAKSFAERFEEMNQSVRRVGFVQNLMLGVEAFKLLYSAGSAVVGIVESIGEKMIGAATHAERFRFSFEAMLGTGGAKEVLDVISQVEKQTEYSRAQLSEMSADMLKAGFGAKDLRSLLGTASDMAAFGGGGLANMQRAIDLIDKIKTTGKIPERALQGMGLGESAGTNLLKQMEAAAKEQGKNYDVKTLKKMMEAGTLPPDFMIEQLQRLVYARTGGNPGTTGAGLSNTVAAQIEKVQQLTDKYFEQLDKTPGYLKFGEALGKLLDKLDPDKPLGKKIFASLSGAFATVAKWINDFVNGGGIDSFAKKMTGIVDELDKLPAILSKVVTFAEVLGTVWVGSAIVGTITSLMSLLPGIATVAGAATGAIGAMSTTVGAMAPQLLAVAAVLTSIEIAYSNIQSTASELGGWSKVWDDVKYKFGDAQPALAGDNANQFSPQWKQDRANGGAAVAAIPSQSARVQPAVASMTPTVTMSIEVNAPSGDADEISAALSSSMPSAMQQAMERAAVASGVL